MDPILDAAGRRRSPATLAGDAGDAGEGVSRGEP